MDLSNRLSIFAYANYSESAKLLAEKTDVWMIKHEGSTFKGKQGSFILNWGAGTGVYNAKTGDATLLNPPEVIDVAVNKLAYFDQMDGPRGPRTPYWTTSKRTVKQWLEDGEVVVARTRLEGCKGDGIVVMKKPLDFVPAPLYTVKVDNVAEYRVYMFNDEVLDYRRKQGKAKDDMLVGDGIEFVIDNNELPPDVIVQVQKAAKRLKLTTQGLDIIWDGKKAYVLETNTAPYLGIQVANKYAKRLEKFVQEQDKAA